MSRQRFFTAADLSRLVQGLIDDGLRVYGPAGRAGSPAPSGVEGPSRPSAGRLGEASLPSSEVEYRRLARAGDLSLDAPLPAMPLKALFLPPSEALFTWRRQHDEVTLTPVGLPCSPAVVIGARPCDAAALDTLDKVMGWDYRDDTWFARREGTTIVTLACGQARGCSTGFCEKVGLAPDSGKGSDVLLAPVAGPEHGFVAEALTEKGETLLQFASQKASATQTAASERRPYPEPVTAASERRPYPEPVKAASERRPYLALIASWLGAHFNDPFWGTLGLRCHGCGACASVCPTCHCFDIVDEADSLLGGTRRRNWDTCQAGKFTVHASGHNPRADQHSRFRQRVLHKFFIYPERFGEVLCTGCGRCVAACPAGQDLPEILDTVAQLAPQHAAPRTQHPAGAEHSS